MKAISPALLLGTRKGLIKLERNGAGWRVTEQEFSGIPVAYAVNDRRTGTAWASMDHGHWGPKLARMRQGEKEWSEVPTPAYPEGTTIGDGTAAAAGYLWVIAPGGEDQPERLYIGTEPGGLFRSDDGGDSFHLVEGLWNHPSREGWFGGGRDQAGIHSIIVDPRDSKRVTIGISVAGVFATEDDGSTWEPRNRGLRADFLPDPEVEVGHDPHFVAACRTAPDTMWQQNHCGIFRSTDGGRNWTDVSQQEGPANFGFAVSVDEGEPDTAWVVPALSDGKRIAIDGALRVCRTDDGGKTWQEFTKGLPSENCFDIVYRHGLDVSGDIVAFGTTTGNLFISEDRGESWECVSNYLPLIYSVRFV